MENTTTSSLSDLFLIAFGSVLGWLLSLCSLLLVQPLQDRRDRKKTRSAVRVELQELLVRTVFSVDGLARASGEVNAQHFDWVLKLLKKHKSCNVDSELIDALAKVTKESQSEIENFLSASSAEIQSRGVSARKYSLPFLERNIDRLRLFEADEARRLLDIVARLEIVHQLIDDAQVYFNRTFESSLSDGNRAINSANLDSAYSMLARANKLLVERIDTLLSAWGDK